MSVEQGADRVAERRRTSRNDPMLNEVGEAIEAGDDKAEVEEDDATPAYTCENCGAHVFLFSRTVTLERCVQESLECSCGESDIAAVREFIDRCTITRTGRLGPDHRVCFEDEEYGEEMEEEEEEVELTVDCQVCLAGASGEEWESEELEGWEEDDESQYCELRCAECDHEIEFGWSHPGQGGRIWPCESAGFNPWLTFPEDRFVEGWKGRKWIRPRRN